MRIFEIVLILLNFITLFLSLRRKSKKARLWMVCANVSLLLAHGIFEGFRYQMVFSYLFIGVFTIYSFLRTRKRVFHAKSTKILKIVGVGSTFIFLGITSYLAYALPVFSLPKPTGSYEVGVQYFPLVDEDRKDPFLDQTNQKRELMIKVYYPAQKDVSKPYDGYFHNSSELIKAFASFYQMPDFVFDQLKLVKTNSKEGLQLSDREQSYPVILFSHGAGTSMEVQTSNCEDLASHGYIVAAIDHTYASSATEFPDRIVTSDKATTDFNSADPAEIISQIMAEDAKFVIDRLSEINQGDLDTIFTDRLNLDDIGVVGHSVGGSVAYNLAMNDSRIKAAIDIDGVVFVTPQGDTNNMAPFLMLANDKYHTQAIQNRTSLMKKFEDMDKIDQQVNESIYGSKEAYKKAYQKATKNITALAEVVRASGNLYTIKGSDHMKFIDIGLFIGSDKLRQLIDIGGATSPKRCLIITEALTVAFFDQKLKNDTTVELAALLNKYPELERVGLK